GGTGVGVPAYQRFSLLAPRTAWPCDTIATPYRKAANDKAQQPAHAGGARNHEQPSIAWPVCCRAWGGRGHCSLSVHPKNVLEPEDEKDQPCDSGDCSDAELTPGVPREARVKEAPSGVARVVGDRTFASRLIVACDLRGRRFTCQIVPTGVEPIPVVDLASYGKLVADLD